jgi:hypothetical protein
MQGEQALYDDNHDVWPCCLAMVLASLTGLGHSEANSGVVQGHLEQAKLLAAGSVQGPERSRPFSHGKLGGGSSGKVGSVTLCRVGAVQAEAAVGEGEGGLVSQGAV